MPHAWEKRFLNGLIKPRCTLGNIFEVHRLSLLVCWKCTEMNPLSSSLWVWPLKAKQQCLTGCWGMTPLSQNGMWLQQTSKIPDAHWSLSKTFRLREMEIKGQKRTDVQPFRAYFGLSPSWVFFSRSWPHPQGNAELNTLSLKPLNLKGKRPAEVSDESQTWAAETLWASLQTTAASSCLAPTLCTEECNSNSSGPISYHCKRKYQLEGPLWENKSRGSLGFPIGKTSPPSTLEAVKLRLLGFCLVESKVDLLTFWELGTLWRKGCSLNTLLAAKDKWGTG